MTPNFVRRIRAWVVMVAIMLAGCSDDPSGPSQTGSVNVNDFAFDPEDIVVAPGATVTWTWNGSANHNVNFDSGAITDSPTQASGSHATAMPMAVGTYTYHCDVHPVAMTGSVQVQ
jgi:plastocyanin